MGSLSYERPIVLIDSLIAEAKFEAVLVSAFVTSDALRAVLSRLQPSVRLSLVVRWSKTDIQMGSSDLGAFDVVREHDGRMFRNSRVHAKLFMVDKKNVVFGSANLTSRGLGMATGVNNVECVSRITQADMKDIAFINSIIRESSCVDRRMIDVMEEELNASTAVEFDESRLEDVCQPVSGVFVNDLPFTARPDALLIRTDSDEARHDIGLYTLGDMEVTLESLATSFIQSDIMRWVDQLVQEPMSFGSFTNALHNALLDDPRPYRKDIKLLQTNLFNWIAVLASDMYCIEVPAGCYRQVIQRK